MAASAVARRLPRSNGAASTAPSRWNSRCPVGAYNGIDAASMITRRTPVAGSTASIRERSLDQLVKSTTPDGSTRPGVCATSPAAVSRVVSRVVWPPAAGCRQRPCRANTRKPSCPQAGAFVPTVPPISVTRPSPSDSRFNVRSRASSPSETLSGPKNPDTADSVPRTFSAAGASSRRRNSSRVPPPTATNATFEPSGAIEICEPATVNSSWPSGRRRSIWTMPAGPPEAVEFSREVQPSAAPATSAAATVTGHIHLWREGAIVVADSPAPSSS